MKKKVLIIIVISLILIITGSILFLAPDKKETKKVNEKENKEKAEKILTDGGVDKNNLVFIKVDSDGNYIYEIESDKSVEYIVDVKKGSYILNQRHRRTAGKDEE